MTREEPKPSAMADMAASSRPLSNIEHEALSIAAAELDLWDWDLKTGTKAISRRSAELIGLTTEEFAALGTAWTDLIHPDDRQRVKEAVIPHLKGKTPLYAVEFRARRKSGDWIWLHSQGKVVDRDERGFATRVMGFDIDITERKSTEAAILNQKDLALGLSATSDLDEALRLCVETALRIAGLDAAGIYVADNNGHLNLVAYKGVSEEFAQACRTMPADLPATQAIFRGLPRYLHARDVAPPMRAILEQEGLQGTASLPITHGRSVIASFYLASRTLQAIPTSIRHLLEGLASQIGGAITRIRAENLLKESEERFRTFAEGLPQIVFEVDTQGKFVFANKAAYEYAGRTPEEVDRGLNVAEVILPADRERLRRNMAKIVAGEKFIPQEYETIRSDGSRAVIVTYSTPVVKEGTVVGIRGLCVDITPLKEAEARLKEALEEKEVLLRELHHRVKNNLQVIQSLLRLQARQMREDAFLTMVRETENRISAMALMHEQYCKSDNLADLNVRAYVSRIVDYLVA
ncbi:MAG: PAS domain S-box protein, partial [Desulfomonile sp.]|nr:PAS domain S-box protein [Desulfomonile sp.]